MISANIPNSIRKAVYRRDGYACALCDDPRHLQIHHCIPKSRGGSDSMHNLITLCAHCHAIAHGNSLFYYPLAIEDIEQDIVEYLADLYAPEWEP